MPLLASPNRGYADWQRVDNWDTGVLWTSQTGSTNAQVVSPVIDVSRNAYLGGYLGCTLGTMQVQIAWYTDSGALTTLGSRTFVMYQGIPNPSQLRLPNLGPFCQITLTGLGGANYGYLARISGTNRYHPLEFIPSTFYALQHINTAIAANATNYYFPGDYYSGPIWANATMSQAWQFRLEVMDTNAAWTTLDITPVAANGYFNQSIIAPPGAWRIGIQNTTATATTENARVWYSMTGSS